jgi:hypothetical protein
LFVKPGIVKAEKRKASLPEVPTGNIPKKLAKNDSADFEVSMGEISGIFKKEKKRVGSAP